jgi:hypothetical protein
MSTRTNPAPVELCAPQLKLATPGPTRLEDGARASLDRCAGHVLTDAEWACARGRLLVFMTILRSWALRGEIISFRTEEEQ